MTLAIALEKAEILAIIAPNTLALRFASEYNSQRQECVAPRSIERIEEALRKATGASWKVQIAGETPNAEQVEGLGKAQPGVTRPTRRAEVDKEPLIQRAIEVLGARRMQEEPGFGVLSSGGGEATAPSQEEEE